MARQAVNDLVGRDMLNLLRRTGSLAVKLPIAALWDCVTFCTFGSRSETEIVMRNHKMQCDVDEIVEGIKQLKRIVNEKKK